MLFTLAEHFSNIHILCHFSRDNGQILVKDWTRAVTVKLTKQQQQQTFKGAFSFKISDKTHETVLTAQSKA